MKLTSDQQAVLTILDEIPLAKSDELIRRFINLKNVEIKKIIEFLKKKDLLEIMEIQEDSWFFHTNKVKKDMIDSELAKKLDTPAYHKFWLEIQKKHPDHIIGAKEKLEEKLGFKY